MSIAPPRSWDSSEHLSRSINSQWYKGMSRLQHEFYIATIEFYKQKNMLFSMLPMTTESVSSPMGLGSDSLPVAVKINGRNTYLSDSMQFYLEYACRISEVGCYYIAPSFRGESSDNTHLSQFFHSEAEIIGDLNDVFSLVEEYLKYLSTHYLNNSRKLLENIVGDISHIESLVSMETIPRCSFDEALSILSPDTKYIQRSDKGFRTLTRAGERELIRFFGGFVWVTHFDHLAVPFYQKFADTENSKALCGDLLFGIGETVGAGERHLTRSDAEQALKMHRVSPEIYEWYLQLKEDRCVQTSGFGMGIERFMLWLLQHNDIRDVPLVPRI